MADMITERANTEIPVNENFGGLESMLTMTSHIEDSRKIAEDMGVFDQKSGKPLTDSQIGSIVHKASAFYVGQTPSGERIVFGVVPEAKPRFTSELPAKTILSYEHALQMENLKAIDSALKAGQINWTEARGQSVRALGGALSVKGRLSQKEQEELRNWGGIEPSAAMNILDREWQSFKSLNETTKFKKQPRIDKDEESNPHRLILAEYPAGETTAAIPFVAGTLLSEKKGAKVVKKVLIGSVLTSAALSACAPVVTPEQPTPVSELPTAVPTLTEQSIISGNGEFVQGDPQLSQNLKDLLSTNFSIDIPQEAAAPFSLDVKGTKFDFVSLQPFENISRKEKLFMRIKNGLIDLDRREVTIDGKTLVVWSYIGGESPEPVLWYPKLTQEQWSSLTSQQKKDLYAGFATPTPLISETPGFDRENEVIAVSFSGLPDGATKVLASYATEASAEVPDPSGPLIPEDLGKGKWGSYSFTENPKGYYEITDKEGNLIPDVKFLQDGTAELKYQGKDLTIAFQAITVKDGLNVGPWKFTKELGWEMRFADLANRDTVTLAELDFNHPKKVQINSTIELYERMSVLENPNYKLGQEFENITVKYLGKTIENVDVTPEKWRLMHSPDYLVGFFAVPKYYDEYFFTESLEAYPMRIITTTGIYRREIYDKSGDLIYNLYRLPVVVKDTPQASKSLKVYNALIKRSELSEEILSLMAEKPWVFKLEINMKPEVPESKDKNNLISDQDLRNYLTRINKWYIDKFYGSDTSVGALPDELEKVYYDVWLVDKRYR